MPPVQQQPVQEQQPQLCAVRMACLCSLYPEVLPQGQQQVWPAAEGPGSLGTSEPWSFLSSKNRQLLRQRQHQHQRRPQLQQMLALVFLLRAGATRCAVWLAPARSAALHRLLLMRMRCWQRRWQRRRVRREEHRAAAAHRAAQRIAEQRRANAMLRAATVGVWGQASCLTYPSPSLNHRQFTGGSSFVLRAATEAAEVAEPAARPSRSTRSKVRRSSAVAAATYGACRACWQRYRKPGRAGAAGAGTASQPACRHHRWHDAAASLSHRGSAAGRQAALSLSVGGAACCPCCSRCRRSHRP